MAQIQDGRGAKRYFFVLRTMTERAWASRPSILANRTTSLSHRVSSSRLKLMRFDFLMKESTPRVEKKRAVPPVGSTWLGPAR